MLNNFKTAFLFIGAIVGAGFATGKEVALYFGKTSFATIIFASVLIATFCGVFLLFGQLSLSNKKLAFANKIFNVVILLATTATFIAMVSGAETLLFSATAARNLGLASGIIGGTLCLFNLEVIKRVNFFVVSLIIIMIVFLAKDASFVFSNSKFSSFSALKYTALNMLLGGYLIKDEGVKMRGRDIFATACIVGLAISAMLIGVMKISGNFVSSEMPVYDFARSRGATIIAAVVIFLAIFSTILGSGKVITDFVKPKKMYWLWAFFVVLTIFSFKLPFGKIVEATYPIISYVGIVYLSYILIVTFWSKLALIIKRKNAKKAFFTTTFK